MSLKNLSFVFTDVLPSVRQPNTIYFIKNSESSSIVVTGDIPSSPLLINGISYTAMSQMEAMAGTSSEARLISSDVLKAVVESHSLTPEQRTSIETISGSGLFSVAPIGSALIAASNPGNGWNKQGSVLLRSAYPLSASLFGNTPLNNPNFVTSATTLTVNPYGIIYDSKSGMGFYFATDNILRQIYKNNQPHQANYLSNISYSGKPAIVYNGFLYVISGSTLTKYDPNLLPNQQTPETSALPESVGSIKNLGDMVLLLPSQTTNYYYWTKDFITFNKITVFNNSSYNRDGEFLYHTTIEGRQYKLINNILNCSFDGVSWTPIQGISNTNRVFKIFYKEGIYYIFYSNEVYSSPDGVNFTLKVSANVGTDIGFDGRFFYTAIGYSETLEASSFTAFPGTLNYFTLLTTGKMFAIDANRALCESKLNNYVETPQFQIPKISNEKLPFPFEYWVKCDD